MFESGDYVIPRVQDTPRLNKPPLIYWLQCASVKLFGDGPGQYPHGNIWVFRVPSVLCAIGSVLLTWRIGLRLLDPLAAALGAALLAVSPIVVWDAHQARADQLLLLCTTAAMLALTHVWTSRFQREHHERAGRTLDWCAPLGFWVAIGAGILAKGPITPMIAGLTIVSLSAMNRRWRWIVHLRPTLGMLMVTAMVLPWVYLAAERVGWSNYAQTIFDETLGRSAAAKEGHWGPPGYHLVLLTMLMWPGSLLTGWAILHDRSAGAAGQSWLRRFISADPGRQFLLAWSVPSWLVFEVISTKLPHYTMPLYPALALLSARAIVNVHRGSAICDLGSRLGFVIWWMVGLAATLGLSGLVIVAGRVDVATGATQSPVRYLLPGAIVLLFLVAAGRSLVRGAFLRAQLQSIVAIVVWGATFLQFVLPGAQRFWVSTRIVGVVNQHPLSSPLINRSDFAEDSLIFLTRGLIHREHGEIDGERSLVLLPAAQPPPIIPERHVRPVETIRGLNYSTGRRVEILIAEVDRITPTPP